MRFSLVNAGIAQLVEQLICNQQVIGSSPIAGSTNQRPDSQMLSRVELPFYLPIRSGS